MPIKKKKPKLERVPLLDNDSRDLKINVFENIFVSETTIVTTGLYTSMDIIKIFPEIKMDALQEWFRQKLIRPSVRSEGPTGYIKHFNRSGLCMIAIFKRLVDLGIPRKNARTETVRFQRKRVEYVKKNNQEPDFISFTIKNKKVMEIAFTAGPFELTRDMKDVAIINFYRILFKIDSYEK